MNLKRLLDNKYSSWDSLILNKKSKKYRFNWLIVNSFALPFSFCVLLTIHWLRFSFADFTILHERIEKER